MRLCSGEMPAPLLARGPLLLILLDSKLFGKKSAKFGVWTAGRGSGAQDVPEVWIVLNKGRD